jgi:hypothetical protein
MSTAPIDSVSPTHARAESVGSRWERLLAVASVCLPIPLLAATGLSIPLPAGVERIGAALVSWADEEAGASPLGEAGTIVLADAEQAAPEGPGGAVLTIRRSTAAGGATAPDADASQPAREGGGGGGTGGGGNNDGGGSNGGGGNNGGGSGPPDPGGNDPGDDPGVIEGTVKEVTGTTKPVVDTVDKTVDEVGGTVDEVGGTVDELLPTEDLLPGLGG